MLTVFLDILHVFFCGVLMFVVLLQQGKGGGMGAAFGGGGAAQVFGGRGAGNLLTRATAFCAASFMITSVSLAYISSSGDRALRAKTALEDQKIKGKGTARPKDTKTDTKPEGSGAAAAPSAGEAPPSAPPGPSSGSAPSPAPAPAPAPAQ
jgi:preprotein translocase subunit SecG